MEKLKKLIHIFRSPALQDIARWTKNVRGSVAMVCVMYMVSSVASLGFTLTTRELVDSAVGRDMGVLVRSACVLGVLILFQQGIGFYTSMLSLKASSRLQREMQHMFTSDLLAKEYPPLKGYHSGELFTRFMSDVNLVKNAALDIPPTLASTFVSFAGAAAILLAMDWRFIILMAAGGFFGFVMAVLFREPMKKRHRKKQAMEEKLNSAVQEAFGSIHLIKSSLSEERTMAKIDVHQRNMEETQLNQGRFSNLLDSGTSLALNITWLLCMVWGCVSIYHGRLTYGSLAAMLQLISRIEGPIVRAFGMARHAYTMVSSAERLQEVLDLPREEENEFLTDFDEIRLEDVSFHYDDSKEMVLKDIRFTVNRGDFVAVTGISGGGKTSLFQLLLGIYRPTGGRVLIRTGEKTVPASRDTRTLFAYVPQGNTLFSGTLQENLLMFTDSATGEDLASAIRCACLEELVDEIGLNGMIGEHGIGLSEGQAQRVAVARALLCGAPVLLLDESTSALDEETEARMLKNISNLKNKTCLIVTHRRAALAICGKRLHLRDGMLSPSHAGGDAEYI